MFRSAILLLSGNAFASLLLLARNLIVARLIPVEDYGIAATFAVAMAVVEMMSALGLQQQIVQAKEGDDPHFQAALQGFQVLRGVISGAALFLIAGPLARFLGIGEVAWAYQALALVPVLNALQHFDIHRMNRQMVFGPMLMTGAAPALLSVLAVWPLSVWSGDYRVMLYAILIQAAVGALTSHLVAERPYRLAFDREIIGRSLRFGWPILVNGVLMFLVFQGDKLIVGRELGMEALAVFSLGMTLTLTPTLVLAKTASNYFLPPLSRAQHEGQAAATDLALVTLQAVLSASLLFLVVLALLGPVLIDLLLGAKYAALQPLLTWFAILQTLRVFKAAPAIIALAAGKSANPMIANLVRLLALPPCWYVAATSGDLTLILWIAIFGELAGHVVAMGLIGRTIRLGDRGVILPHLAAALLLAAVAALAELHLLTDIRAGGALLVLFALGLTCQPHLRRHLRQGRPRE